MFAWTSSPRVFALFLLVSSGGLLAAEAGPAPAVPVGAGHGGAVCGAGGNYFLDEVWAKVAARSCLKCHKAGGDAEESKLVLQDPARVAEAERTGALAHNRAALARMAAVVEEKAGGKSRLLLKASGQWEHEGEEVLAAGSAEYQILAEFARRVQAAGGEKSLAEAAAAAEQNAPPFFEGVVLLDDQRLLRRLTLSLAGRLPTAEERAAMARGKENLAGLDAILDGVMQEEAFYTRLAEAFNDIFLVRGYGDGATSALSYDHFSETRHWAEKHDLSRIADEKAREKARYKLWDDYREALLREPLELVKHLVRTGRPFTEIVTADYIMVSPYTARGYGIFDGVKDKFKNAEDPFEFIPARLPALKHRDSERFHQKSETGFYPHAGMLGMFQYLRRFPTTETNRNRLRARMVYQHFLGVDVLELAARVTDAAAVSAKYEIPTMQAAECTVCHKTLDPLAGMFQDYYSLEGVFGPRKEGWFADIFAAGYEGEDLPPAQKWRSLPWLGERTARDPRFATTMVEHVYYALTGRKTLLPPKGIDDPLFAAKQRAYAAQRQEVSAITARFVQADFNLKEAFKGWASSSFYRADGLATAELNPARRAELDDLGVARMLSPEQLERKIAAIFGKPWGRLTDPEFALLYGGIDSQEVTERAADPSGAMGAIQRTMANDVACQQVAADFAREAGKRRLFPLIEPDVVPDESPDSEARIRAALVHLYQLVLGREELADGEEVSRAFALFDGILAEAREQKNLDPRENYHCRPPGEDRPMDENYTLRAWRGVLTYLLRQREFLYE